MVAKVAMREETANACLQCSPKNPAFWIVNAFHMIIAESPHHH